MDRYSGEQDRTPFCTFTFFDCVSSKDDATRPHTGASAVVPREMKVLYNQPHLVEPMKLRVYDDLPATPNLVDTSHLSQWGRSLASRASSRASRISIKTMKRRATSKLMISKPLPMVYSSDDLPLRRRRQFSPLTLSIYDPANRLSDLPEFDRLSFTEVGELKMPPKALLRTQSECIMETHAPVLDNAPKTASMFEVGGVVFARPGTSGSIVSISRPPSEYDALHSHPVSWASLPGISTTKTYKTDVSVDILTPMQEEFSPISPIATAITVDGTVLNFPSQIQPPPPAAEIQAPFPVVSRGPSTRSTTTTLRASRRDSVRPYFHANFQAQNRISQWLQSRTHAASNSTNTFDSSATSTNGSFAEHRRKRSEFYKLGQVQPDTQHIQVPVLTSTTSPPQALNFSKPSPPQQQLQGQPQYNQTHITHSYNHTSPPLLSSSSSTAPLAQYNHHRTVTESTFQSTIGTSVLSSGDSDRDSLRFSRDSMATLSFVDCSSTMYKRSRSSTVKSIMSPASGGFGGMKIVTVEEKEVAISPALTGEIVSALGGMDEENEVHYIGRGGDVVQSRLFLNEIHGPLRSPGVGVAF